MKLVWIKVEDNFGLGFLDRKEHLIIEDMDDEVHPGCLHRNEIPKSPEGYSEIHHGGCMWYCSKEEKKKK